MDHTSQHYQPGQVQLHGSSAIHNFNKNAKVWSPRPIIKLDVDREEVVGAVTGRNKERIVLIDVRSKREYFKKNLGDRYSEPNLQALNIPWKEFYTRSGRPNLAMKDQLVGVGIRPSDRILVISNKGVRSAAVNYALLTMGFKNAGNVSGGVKELEGKAGSGFY